MTETVGEKIRTIRKSKRISQVSLSKTAGISQSTLSAIETNAQSPSITTLQAIASALGCTLPELTSNEKNSPPEGEELRDSVKDLLVGLSPEDVQRVRDFVAGLKAARKG